jgi:peptide/nickel transport system permease protein
MTTAATIDARETARAQRETFWNRRWVRRFRRNHLAIAGLAIVVLFALTAAFAPLLAPPQGNCLRDLNVSEGTSVYNPVQPLFWKALFTPPASCFSIVRVGFSPIPTPPGQGLFPGEGGGPILGTINGYDIFYGIVWGTRTAFTLAFLVIIPTLIIGILLGSTSGYFGGWIDNVLMRATDVVFAFPGLVLTIVLVSLFGQGLTNIAIALVLVGWGGYARILRGEILRVRQLEYVDAARALGTSSPRIILKHVLPNSLTGLTVQATLDMGSIVLTAAALSFIGLGTPMGYADWGQLISFARAWIQGPPGQPFLYWYVSFFPGITILMFGLGWNLLGDALRDALDPRET